MHIIYVEYAYIHDIWYIVSLDNSVRTFTPWQKFWKLCSKTLLLICILSTFSFQPFTFEWWVLRALFYYVISIGVQRGVSEEVEDAEVARPQSVEGSGMAGPSNTLRSPWPPLSIHPWSEMNFDARNSTVVNNSLHSKFKLCRMIAEFDQSWMERSTSVWQGVAMDS
jgi:hypothetical protein